MKFPTSFMNQHLEVNEKKIQRKLQTTVANRTTGKCRIQPKEVSPINRLQRHNRLGCTWSSKTIVIKASGRVKVLRKLKNGQVSVQALSTLVRRTHPDWWFGDVLLTTVSVLWCLWQKIWTVLNTSRYWIQNYCLLLPGISSENDGISKTTMPRLTHLLKLNTGSEGMNFTVILTTTEPRSKSDRKCVVCTEICCEKEHLQR